MVVSSLASRASGSLEAAAAVGRLTSRPRSLASVSSSRHRGARRAAHTRAPLDYDIDEGLKNFLKPETLRLLAVDYQDGVLSELTRLSRGTDFANKSVFDTLIATAAQRQHILAFNYAAEALNNSFFLSRLSPDPRFEPESGAMLSKAISHTFGSLDALKAQFRASACGMMGSGWLWLAFDQAGRIIIVGTYGPGTIVATKGQDARFVKLAVLGEDGRPSALGKPGSRLRDLDPSAASGRIIMPDYSVNPRSSIQTIAQADRHASKSFTPEQGWSTSLSGRDHKVMRSIGAELYPIACLSVHERAYMRDHGLFGRGEYADALWTVFDWSHADAHYRSIVEGKDIGR